MPSFRFERRVRLTLTVLPSNDSQLIHDYRCILNAPDGLIKHGDTVSPDKFSLSVRRLSDRDSAIDRPSSLKRNS